MDALGITARSTLGSIVGRTGGLSIGGGWLRLLGSPTRSPNDAEASARDIVKWNCACQGTKDVGGFPFLLVGDDASGGFFALDAWGIEDAAPGEIAYAAPDTLDWEPLGVGYTAFAQWCLEESLDGFYERFEAIREEGGPWPADEALSFYPFLWSAEGGDPSAASRRLVPIGEVYAMRLGPLVAS